MIFLWALMIALLTAMVLLFIGQRTANTLLSAIAISLCALLTAVLAAMYGFHHKYWSAAVFAALAFTQATSARRKWIGSQSEAPR